MSPFEYRVVRIDGDYAHLLRTDIPTDETILVARALLPDDIDEGTMLLWEDLEYTVIG